jgi:hypothetical protein
VEVKIGVQYAARELVLESTLTPEEVEQAVSDAIRSELGVLSLQDDQGRLIVVAVNKLAYIEIAESEGLRVGFGAAM